MQLNYWLSNVWENTCKRIMAADGLHWIKLILRRQLIVVAHWLGMPTKSKHIAMTNQRDLPPPLRTRSWPPDTQPPLNLDDEPSYQLTPNPLLNLNPLPGSGPQAWVNHSPDTNCMRVCSKIYCGLQLYMARLIFDSERARLLAHSHLTTKGETTCHLFRAILNSVAPKGASACLFAFLNGGLSQRMTLLERKSAISYLLNTKCSVV